MSHDEKNFCANVSLKETMEVALKKLYSQKPFFVKLRAPRMNRDLVVIMVSFEYKGCRCSSGCCPCRSSLKFMAERV